MGVFSGKTLSNLEKRGYRRGYRSPGGKLRRIFRKNGKRWGCEDRRGRGGGMGSSSADTSDDLSDSWSNECLDD
ncbi:Hypothetical predicted protein [Mytilus galloprovincialis]|uniref:Uncharacterized protein n=1 Tax=Mytilus galloprovincialis TaxID=29158 RepID=A0A8B6EHQ9_MYTGA|nr:Hypothetical predicted protein [Mytilus galloprovincialis]